MGKTSNQLINNQQSKSTFLEEDMQMVSRHKKRRSMNISHQENANQHCRDTQVPKILNRMTSTGENVEKPKLSHWWECRMVQPL
jgi:hypothetical protein